MSSAVEDFASPTPSVTPSYFQNPNPSVQNHPIDPGLFNNSINVMNFTKLDFDCSNHTAPTTTEAATVRSSRRKPVKVKKHSNCSDSVSVKTKTVNRTFNSNNTGFVFNSSNLGHTGNDDDNNMLRFSIGATSNSNFAEKIGSQEVPTTKNSGNGFLPGPVNLSFAFGADEKVHTGNFSETGGNKFGKFNGMENLFGDKINNGVMKSNSNSCTTGDKYGSNGVAFHVNDSEFVSTVGRSGVDGLDKVNKFTTEIDSELVKSISSLNLGTGDVGSLMNDNFKREENNTSDSIKINNLDFVFSANHRDSWIDANDLKEESKDNVGKLVPDGSGEMKLDANIIFRKSRESGSAAEDLGKKDFSMSSTELKHGDSVNRDIDSGIMFPNSNFNGVFHVGTQNERSSFKGSRNLNDEMNILKGNGAGCCDYLKKQENNIDSVCDGINSSTFGSNLGSAFSDSPFSKVPNETKASNIHEPQKVNPTNNLFVFGNDNKTDEIDKKPSVEEKGKSDTVTNVYSCNNSETSASSDGGVLNGESKASGNIRNQNQPINQNEKSSDGSQHYQDHLKVEAELKNTIPSSFSFSTIGLGFVPKETNNTGFNIPEINFACSFTSDMFPGLDKKIDFNKSNSVDQRKLKKNKAKLRQQGVRTVLSKEAPQSFEESSGCSPMDVSPYGGTEYVSTSTKHATGQVKSEDDAGTTEKISTKSFSSSSATPFADADVSVRQRPHQKKYKMKSGHGSEFRTPKNRVNISRTHESTSREHLEASDQELCDKWRKRGNQAYKNGNLSEAEGCYSKGISSVQHAVTPEFCIEPLLLCYSNRAAARMALGMMREGLKDCRMAAALDPNFVKANLRSANCHLLLGELEDATYYYNKCLESENIICLDRRIAIDAADGLQKAQKVADHLKLSAELLQLKTYESATKALGIIVDALSISCYSEELLNKKGNALFLLGKHKEVVQLCEQTLDSAEKNFATGGVAGHTNLLKLWRWNLMSKSYFHMGRLELALELIEKHEQLRPTVDKTLGSEELLIPLAVTIRELLHCKNAGNEAFQSGKHTEAVEHYTAAISKNIESHTFAAVCFCNRAAAHQSLGEIIDAIGDCSIAIALDGSYPKALSRRSTLWEMIRDYKHAADDLQRFISILEIQSRDSSQKSPTPGKAVNGSVKDLRKARRRLSSMEEKAKTERSLDLYLILGIKPSDAAADIKKAYRKAALRHHPDKAGQVLARAESGNDGQQWKVITESIQMDADRLFKMIGEAYAVLSDSTKRSKYDLDEEMWDDTYVNVSSSSRRAASNFYSSPFETPNRRNSQESRKTYSNTHYYPWEDSGRTYHRSYSRW